MFKWRSQPTWTESGGRTSPTSPPAGLSGSYSICSGCTTVSGYSQRGATPLLCCSGSKGGKENFVRIVNIFLTIFWRPKLLLWVRPAAGGDGGDAEDVEEEDEKEEENSGDDVHDQDGCGVWEKALGSHRLPSQAEKLFITKYLFINILFSSLPENTTKILVVLYFRLKTSVRVYPCCALENFKQLWKVCIFNFQLIRFY